jgi:hypothetical protein
MLVWVGRTDGRHGSPIGLGTGTGRHTVLREVVDRGTGMGRLTVPREVVDLRTGGGLGKRRVIRGSRFVIWDHDACSGMRLVLLDLVAFLLLF